MLRYFFNNETTTLVDEQLDAVLTEMQTVGVNSEEFPKMLGYLERLNKIKTDERQDPVSRDTIALIFGNLMGILLIVAYEQKHLVTSKGFNQIIRPKGT